MSIYSIANYAAGTTYNIHDIVRYPSNTANFYYSLGDGQVGNTPSTSSTAWGGLSSFNGIIKPKFIWRTNYRITAQHEPAPLAIKSEGGYEQRVVVKINTS